LSNVELFWDHEIYRRALEYWAKHVRMVPFDKRGIGSSDRFEQAPTLEQRIGDVLAVMDAAEVKRASLVGLSEGGLIAQLFAVRHPERVDRLVLANSALAMSYWDAAEKYAEPGEELPPLEVTIEQFQKLVETWGDDPQYLVDWMAPSQSTNASTVRWAGRLERQSASPADVARQIEAIFYLDGVDPADISVPTLVLQVKGDRVIPACSGRFLADRIPGATLLELEGEDHFLWMMPSWREIGNAAIEFITGHPIPSGSERRFAAILFTDLVDSTASSVKAGDTAWSAILDSHERISRGAIERHKGRVIKGTGDGFLATFDAPSQAVLAAKEVVQGLGAIGLAVRAGVHAGEVEYREDGDVSGTAVNLAARVEERAAARTVWVSSTVRDLLLGSEHAFSECGEFVLKGIPGVWRLYCVQN
jgi:class 3 adenylate cyclase